ncbi:CD276 antigen-like isoform X2 [Dunckerocampus dactyliophorus]|uniref:CD276 antigen-like isoform X2 n=1 Tax=Dunckerocampus dactyliophorus TaxID=161453 RepID=UPI002405D628|nr:CD276 antigen-like isoform X2 [Dunckerocampus dactyliophorus]
MSASCIWACFLFAISAAAAATQDKTPDVTVTCLVSEECLLPCSFPLATKESVRWFRQDVVVFSFRRGDNGSQTASQVFAGRAAMFPQLISGGNATLMLKEVGLMDRGTYRCYVRTSKGEHNAKVVLKVEAPIQGLSLELYRLSGYEEMKCIVRNVFPPPRVTWATEPPTFEDLRPITRMLADKRGLYTADSRLRTLSGQPDLIYVCKVSTSYGGPTWTSSLREREIRGSEGRDLTIPCFAPPYLNNPTLHWSFTNGEDPAHILTYDSRSGDSVSTPPWDDHVELDGFRVPFGDGSLRLMDPDHAVHTGTYSCVFSVPYNTHTERTDVSIEGPTVNRSTSEAASYWWIVALAVAVLILGLVAMFAYLKLKGSAAKPPRRDPEEVTELNSVKDVGGESQMSEDGRFLAGGTNGQSGLS